MTSFLRLVEDLLREPTERAAYLADPAGYLPSRGFADFDTTDVELSLSLTADAFPPALAELIDPQAGLDSVVAVDPDALPGLWAPSDDADHGLDALDVDDPFVEIDPDPDLDDATAFDEVPDLLVDEFDGAPDPAQLVDVPTEMHGIDAGDLLAAPDLDAFDADGALDGVDPIDGGAEVSDSVDDVFDDPFDGLLDS